MTHGRKPNSSAAFGNNFVHANTGSNGANCSSNQQRWISFLEHPQIDTKIGIMLWFCSKNRHLNSCVSTGRWGKLF